MVVPLLLSLALALSWTGTELAAAERGAELSLPGGTVLSIDQETASLTLLLPSGESRLFVAVDRRLLRDIKTNDHVIFELNDAGELTKLVKLPTDPAN